MRTPIFHRRPLPIWVAQATRLSRSATRRPERNKTTYYLQARIKAESLKNLRSHPANRAHIPTWVAQATRLSRSATRRPERNKTTYYLQARIKAESLKNLPPHPANRQPPDPR
jgi:hypothetical protein